MRLTTLIKLAVKSIRKHRMRSALTMLGIIIGVSAVLVMVALLASYLPVRRALRVNPVHALRSDGR